MIYRNDYLRRAICVLFCLMPMMSLWAQTNEEKERGAIRAKKLKLMVLLEAEDAEYVGKQAPKKRGQQEIDRYRSEIETYNQAIIKAVSALWEYSPEYEIVQAKDYADFVEANKESVAILYLSTQLARRDPFSIANATRYWKTENFQIRGVTIPRLTLSVPGIDQPLIKTPLAEGGYDAGTLGLALVDMQSWLEYWAKGEMLHLFANKDRKHPQLLKDYTLVVRDIDLHQSLSQAEAKNEWPYKLKVVNQETFEKIVLAREPKHAILYPFRNGASTGGTITTVNFAQYIIAPDTRQLVTIGAPKVLLATTTGSYAKLKSKHLKSYAKAAK